MKTTGSRWRVISGWPGGDGARERYRWPVGVMVSTMVIIEHDIQADYLSINPHTARLYTQEFDNSLLDKVSGRDVFYANRSIKKALIGYRGAWHRLC